MFHFSEGIQRKLKREWEGNGKLFHLSLPRRNVHVYTINFGFKLLSRCQIMKCIVLLESNKADSSQK